MISIKLSMSTIESVDLVYKSVDKNINLKIQVQWNEILILSFTVLPLCLFLLRYKWMKSLVMNKTSTSKSFQLHYMYLYTFVLFLPCWWWNPALHFIYHPANSQANNTRVNSKIFKMLRLPLKKCTLPMLLQKIFEGFKTRSHWINVKFPLIIFRKWGS